MVIIHYKWVASNLTGSDVQGMQGSRMGVCWSGGNRTTASVYPAVQSTGLVGTGGVKLNTDMAVQTEGVWYRGSGGVACMDGENIHLPSTGITPRIPELGHQSTDSTICRASLHPSPQQLARLILDRIQFNLDRPLRSHQDPLSPHGRQHLPNRTPNAQVALPALRVCQVSIRADDLGGRSRGKEGGVWGRGEGGGRGKKQEVDDKGFCSVVRRATIHQLADGIRWG